MEAIKMADNIYTNNIKFTNKTDIKINDNIMATQKHLQGEPTHVTRIEPEKTNAFAWKDQENEGLLREEQVTDTLMSLAVEHANKGLEPSYFKLSYSIHDGTNQIMVKVMDASSDEVVREVPSESRLDALTKIMEYAGLIFDGRG